LPGRGLTVEISPLSRRDPEGEDSRGRETPRFVAVDTMLHFLNLSHFGQVARAKCNSTFARWTCLAGVKPLPGGSGDAGTWRYATFRCRIHRPTRVDHPHDSLHLGFECCPLSYRFLDLLLVELTWNLRAREVSHKGYKALRSHSGMT
jgi:hypothetical protein